MSGFQRMIAIPQEEYIQLTTLQNVQRPEAEKMAQLTQQFQTQSHISNPYDRMVLQGSTLEEMKQLKEKIRENLSLGTPKPYRNRALSLYRSLEPVVKFSELGELYGDDDKPIQDSRAEDLIQHAVRDRRRHFTPTAWNYFLKLLKKHNIPRTILNRNTLEELEVKPEILTKPKNLPSLKPLKRLIKPFVTLARNLTPKHKRRKSIPSSHYKDTEFLKDF